LWLVSYPEPLPGKKVNENLFVIIYSSFARSGGRLTCHPMNPLAFSGGSSYMRYGCVHKYGLLCGNVSGDLEVKAVSRSGF